jgi:outer membrane translocation and assembly module TamA
VAKGLPYRRGIGEHAAVLLRARLLGWMMSVCVALCATTTLTGCTHKPAEKVPGETDFEVARVSVVPAPDSKEVAIGALLPKLGSRVANALYTARRYNPFRVAEDRRRIQSYLQTIGYLDASVDEPVVQLDETKREAVLTFRYHTSVHYTLSELRMTGVPEGVSLDGYRKAEPGGSYDLEALRVVRYDMAAEVQRAGYGHARVYVRTYVDRVEHRVHVVYFCDAGPKTKVGSVTIEGNKVVTEQDIRDRLGLVTGEPYSLRARDKAEADVYDTAAFTQVVVETNADVEQYLGDVPDSGGVIDPSRVDADGNLIPRKLPETVDLVVHVDEAPRARIRLRGTVELDPYRFDATAGAGAELRNIFGSLHHVVARGRVGFGYIWKDDPFSTAGLYGDALLRYVRPGLLGRIGDARLSTAFREALYPGFRLRELTAGPGLRSTLAPGVFLDVDALFRAAWQVDFGPFDARERDAFRLADQDQYLGLEASAAWVWDARNDPVEATRGHYLAARASASPVGTHTYVQVMPEARGFLPLGDNFSLGAQVMAGWVFGYGDSGVPLGPRFFGGGNFGMRGSGRDRLSPVAQACLAPGNCAGELVGGLSITEAKVELRFLPLQKQAGITVFTDAGAVGARANPFENGLQMAAGLGPRLRLWYVPLSLDVAYRFLDQSKFVDGGLRVFARIGESF